MELTKELYNEHFEMLYRIARNILGDESSAEDAVHDTFLGYYRMPRLNTEVKFTLIKILKNACYDRWRRERRYTDIIYDIADEGGGYEDIYNSSTILGMVESAIQKLGEEQKKIFELRYYANMGYRSICTVLNKDYTNVVNTYNECIGIVKGHIQNANIKKKLNSKYRVIPSKYVPRPPKERSNEIIILDTKTGERVTMKVAALLSGCNERTLWMRFQRKSKSETRFKRLN